MNVAATILGSGIAFIGGSVVAVAPPSLQQASHADAGAMQWVVNRYTLMLGALILLGGAAGDRFGRRRAFMAGIGCSRCPRRRAAWRRTRRPWCWRARSRASAAR